MKIVRSEKGLVHCCAICYTCGWEDGGQHTASRKAAQHVRETGHEVGVEFGYTQIVRTAQ